MVPLHVSRTYADPSALDASNVLVSKHHILRDGGTNVLELEDGSGRACRLRYDLAIGSPTRGRVFLNDEATPVTIGTQSAVALGVLLRVLLTRGPGGAHRENSLAAAPERAFKFQQLVTVARAIGADALSGA